MQVTCHFGQMYGLQDLQWSQELQEQSCETNLRTKITEQLRYIPNKEQGEELFHYIVIHQLIQSDTKQTVQVLTDN